MSYILDVLVLLINVKKKACDELKHGFHNDISDIY